MCERDLLQINSYIVDIYKEGSVKLHSQVPTLVHLHAFFNNILYHISNQCLFFISKVEFGIWIEFLILRALFFCGFSVYYLWNCKCFFSINIFLKLVLRYFYTFKNYFTTI